MSKRCVCLEHVGDNGPCPAHPAGQVSPAGAASLFTGHAREDAAAVAFASPIICKIGGYDIHVGDELVVRRTSDRKACILSRTKKTNEPVAVVGIDEVNQLVGFPLFKEE